jgi:protein-arginine kinase activator protein McsA
MNYKSIGELGQNCVIGELSKYGLGISFLLSDNYPFDFIVIAGKKLFKVQVKTSTKNKEEEYVDFNLTSSNWYKGTTTKYTKDDCDIIICYDLVNHNSFLLAPKDFENRRSFTIRYKKSKNNQSKTVNWYEDYILSAKRIKEIFDFDAPDLKIYYSYKEKYELVCKKCGKTFLSAYKRNSYCGSKCRGEEHRKVNNRPSKEDLIELIKNNTIVKIGKIYNISDNAVRKWAKNYGVNIKEIKSTPLYSTE